jgi:hypothetical protein
MGKRAKNDQAGGTIKGMAARILEEVIKADMSMHAAQIDAWMKFKKYRPKGELINNDIHIGFADKRYLCLNEVKLSFHIKSIPLNVANRIKLAISLLKGKSSLALYTPVIFDFCPPGDEDAVSMEIRVKRFENGTVQASYGPVDNDTDDLLKKFTHQR